jgi:aldose 1-epimerase
MKRKLVFLLSGFLLLAVSSCKWSVDVQDSKTEDNQNVTVMKSPFGNAENREIFLYTITNKNGTTIKITNYGGIITSIMVPDKNGRFGDIVLGYDSLSGYLAATPYFGAMVGRYANRIAKGKFSLDGKRYVLAVNNGSNTLHGGIKGFDKVVWESAAYSDTAESGIVLTYLSKDGEEGYPGNLRAKVTYALNNQDELIIRIEAETDKATPVNLCNHTYFNLSEADTSILGHQLRIVANRFTEVNDELIPTGKLPDVAGTPMDFNNPAVIGSRIEQVPGGYDHNYVLKKAPGTLELAAMLYDPRSGRQVDVLTTQPGFQFYSGNFLDGSITGKNGKVYQKHWGLCLETQHFPDSPNQAGFPNTILRPGEKYSETTVYRFSH